MMKPGAPQVVTSMYDLILYLVPQVSKFPRSQRYLLGDRLEMACFDVLEMLISATYARDKMHILERANTRLEQVRYYVRLCKDLKLLSIHRYEVSSKKVNDVGMQLGGWIKSQRKRA